MKWILKWTGRAAQWTYKDNGLLVTSVRPGVVGLDEAHVLHHDKLVVLPGMHSHQHLHKNINSTNFLSSQSHVPLWQNTPLLGRCFISSQRRPTGLSWEHDYYTDDYGTFTKYLFFSYHQLQGHLDTKNNVIKSWMHKHNDHNVVPAVQVLMKTHRCWSVYYQHQKMSPSCINDQWSTIYRYLGRYIHTKKTSTLQIYACDENCPRSLWDSKTRPQPLVLAADDCRAPFWVLCVICLDIYPPE